MGPQGVRHGGGQSGGTQVQAAGAGVHAALCLHDGPARSRESALAPPAPGGFWLLSVPAQRKNKEKGEAVAWGALAVWFWGKRQGVWWPRDSSSCSGGSWGCSRGVGAASEASRAWVHTHTGAGGWCVHTGSCLPCCPCLVAMRRTRWWERCGMRAGKVFDTPGPGLGGQDRGSVRGEEKAESP